MLSAAIVLVVTGLNLIFPAACSPEVALEPAIVVTAAPDLVRWLNHLQGEQILNPPQPKNLSAARSSSDMKDLKGTLWVLEITTSHVIANHVAAVHAYHKIQRVAHHCRP